MLSFGTLYSGDWILDRLTLQDGPYKGREVVAVLATRKPDQAFPLGSGMVVEVFNPPPGAPGIPILQMRRADGTIKWTREIYANKPGDTAWIELRSTEQEMFGVCVHGSVRWSFGHEAAWFNFSRGGRLKNYYFSW